MSDNGTILENGAMRFERLLPGPIERVWSWLANGDKRALWLAGGGSFSANNQTTAFEFNNLELTDHDETTPEKYAEFADGVTYDLSTTVFEPPHKMSWRWPSPHHADSIVEITLTEEGDKVRLVLIHQGYADGEELLGTLAGWHTHLDIMRDRLTDQSPPPFWSTHDEWMETYRNDFKDFLKTLK